MKYKAVSLLFAFISLFLSSTLLGQEAVWDVDFRTIFDNREGESEVAAAKTFFLTQLSPSIGISLLDGEHTVMGGVSWTQPIGNEWDGYRISPTLYYQYSKKGLKGFLGMFPRTLLHRELPDYIWNDSIYYVQRNVRGAGIVNVGKHGYFQAILDWRGMQSRKQREAFNIIAMGEWRNSEQSLISIGGVAMMNHLARREGDELDEEGVVDNFIVNPYLGVDFIRYAPCFKRLDVQLGMLGSVTRDRKFDNRWRVPFGFWMDLRLRWKWLGVREEIYVGGKLFPYYNVYGYILDQGEPYYSSNFYSRTELQGYILDKSFVTLRASLDFHIAGKELMFYQRLILNVHFDGSFGKRAASK